MTTYTPHTYQTFATNHILTHPRAVLLLDMGLGKTVITLTAINHLIATNRIKQVLIVAPLRVARDTWPTELTKWDHLTHLTHTLITGTPAQRAHALTASTDIHIISRDNLAWLANQQPLPTYDMIVFDELSSFKNHQSARSRAALRLARNTSRVVGLTGTPSPNGLIDLWAQYRIIDDGQRLGTRLTTYRETFFLPDKRNAHQIFSWKPRPDTEHKIFALLDDITISMRSIDHLVLPPVTYVDAAIHLPSDAQAVYAALERDLLATVDGSSIDAGNAGVLVGKLHQIASGAVYLDTGHVASVHESKMEALVDIIEAAAGQSVLVAYWFKHEAARLLHAFPTARCIMTRHDIAEWNRGDISLGLIHPASAGHGLNLQTGGHILVWHTLPWSLELYQQTNARLYRQGQTHPVVIIHLMGAGTVDEQIKSALDRKNFSQAALIDAVKAHVSEGGQR